MLTFVYVFAWAIVSPIFTVRINQVLGDIFLTGVFVSLLYIIGIVMDIPFGYLADKINTKTLIQIALVPYILIPIGYAFINEVMPFFAIRILHGFGACLIWVAIWSYTREVKGKQEFRGEEVSIVTYSMDLASILGPLIGGLIISFFYWELTFYIMSVFMVLALLIASFKLKKAPGKKTYPAFKKEFLDVLHIKQLPLLAVLVIIMAFMGALIWTFIPILLFEKGFNFLEIGLFFTITAFPSLFMELSVGLYTDKIGRKNAMIFGLILNVLSFIVLAFALELYTVYVAAIIGGMAWVFFKIASHTYVSDIVKQGEEGMTSGFMMTFNDFGMFLGALAGGFLFRFFPTSQVFSFCAILLGIGFFLSLFLPRTLIRSSKSL